MESWVRLWRRQTKMSVVMRFISFQVSQMSSQAGFWARLSQFFIFSLRPRPRLGSFSSRPSLLERCNLARKNKTKKARHGVRMKATQPLQGISEVNTSRHEKMAENFSRCAIQWMCRRWLAAQQLCTNYSDVFQFHTGMRSMLPICRSTTWLHRSVFTPITWF